MAEEETLVLNSKDGHECKEIKHSDEHFKINLPAAFTVVVIFIFLFASRSLFLNQAIDTFDVYNDASSFLIISVCVERKDDVWGAQTGSWRQITMRNHRAYANAHGYNYTVVTTSSNSRNARFLKSSVILSAMDKSYDWYFWTDCDTLFMNMTRKLSEFTMSNKSLIISGDMHCAFNAGQMLMKKVPWVVEMLRFTDQCDVIGPCGNKCSMGRDQQLFNYFVWGNCKTSWGNFEREKSCNGAVRQAKESIRDEIYCFEHLASYAGDYTKLYAQKNIFRLHFAGEQSVKSKEIKKYSSKVFYSSSRWRNILQTFY